MTLQPRHWVALALVVVVMTGVVAWANGWFVSNVPGTSLIPDPSITVTGDPATAHRQLDELSVKPRGSMTGYSRERFPHWIMIAGECDTRETVLKRDGQDVQVDSQCRAVWGRWFSPYDGATWTQASDVDVDHFVPLAESWRSGAAQWTQEKRRKFANDLTHHQLISVTDNVNQAKGDSAPDEWKPPLVGYWCTYSINWIEVKHDYGLSITSTEKTALLDMLSRC